MKATTKVCLVSAAFTVFEVIVFWGFFRSLHWGIYLGAFVLFGAMNFNGLLQLTATWKTAGK